MDKETRAGAAPPGDESDESGAPIVSQRTSPADVHSVACRRPRTSLTDVEWTARFSGRIVGPEVGLPFRDTPDPDDNYASGHRSNEKREDSSVPLPERQAGVRMCKGTENSVEITSPMHREETEGFFSVGGRSRDSANDGGASSRSLSPCSPASPSGFSSGVPSASDGEAGVSASCEVVGDTEGHREASQNRGEGSFVAEVCSQQNVFFSVGDTVNRDIALHSTSFDGPDTTALQSRRRGVQGARGAHSNGAVSRSQTGVGGRGCKQSCPGFPKSENEEVALPPEEETRGKDARQTMLETMLRAEEERGMAKGKQREQLLHRLLIEPKLEMFPVHVDRDRVPSGLWMPSPPARTLEPRAELLLEETSCEIERTVGDARASATRSEEGRYHPRAKDSASMHSRSISAEEHCDGVAQCQSEPGSRGTVSPPSPSACPGTSGGLRPEASLTGAPADGKASHGIRGAEAGGGGFGRPSSGRDNALGSPGRTDVEERADKSLNKSKSTVPSCGARFGLMPFTTAEKKSALRVGASTEAARFLSGTFCEPEAVEALWKKKTHLDSIFDGEMDWLYRAARDSIFPRDGYSKKHFNRAGDKIEEICDALFFYVGQSRRDGTLRNEEDTTGRPGTTSETDGGGLCSTRSPYEVHESGKKGEDSCGASYRLRQEPRSTEEFAKQCGEGSHWRRLRVLLGDPSRKGSSGCVELPRAHPSRRMTIERDKQDEGVRPTGEDGEAAGEVRDERRGEQKKASASGDSDERKQPFCPSSHRFFVDVCGGPGAWSLFLLTEPSHGSRRRTAPDFSLSGSKSENSRAEEDRVPDDSPRSESKDVCPTSQVGPEAGGERAQRRTPSALALREGCSQQEREGKRRERGSQTEHHADGGAGLVVCGFGMTLASGAAEKAGQRDRAIWYPQLLRHPRWNAVWGEDGTGNVYRLRNLAFSKRLIAKMIRQRLRSLAKQGEESLQGSEQAEKEERRAGYMGSLDTKLAEEGGAREAEANPERSSSSSLPSTSSSVFSKRQTDVTLGGSLSSEQMGEVSCGGKEGEAAFATCRASSLVDPDNIISPVGSSQDQALLRGRPSASGSLALKTHGTISTTASSEGDSIADASPGSSASVLGGVLVPPPLIDTEDTPEVEEENKKEGENKEGLGARQQEEEDKREDYLPGDGTMSRGDGLGTEKEAGGEEEEEEEDEYSGVRHVSLVVADGGFHLALRAMSPPVDEKTGRHIENFQELLCARLLLSELLFALMLLEERGTFVCKIFDTFTHFTASLIYVVGRLFEECFIVKPVGSRAANSERYLIGLRLRSRKSMDFMRLFDVVRGVHAMWERGGKGEAKLAEDESPESLVPVDLFLSDVRFVESLGAASRFLCLKQSLALDMVYRKYVELKANPAEFASLLRSSAYAYHVTSRFYSSHYVASLPSIGGKYSGSSKTTQKRHWNSQSAGQADHAERLFPIHTDKQMPHALRLQQQQPQCASVSGHSGESARRRSEQGSHGVGWPSRRRGSGRARREADGPPFSQFSRGKGGSEPFFLQNRRRQRGAKEKNIDPALFLESWEASTEVVSDEASSQSQVGRGQEGLLVDGMGVDSRNEGSQECSGVAEAAEKRSSGKEPGENTAPKTASQGGSSGFIIELQGRRVGGECGRRNSGLGVSSPREKEQMSAYEAHMQQLQAQHEQRLLQHGAGRGYQRPGGRGGHRDPGNSRNSASFSKCPSGNTSAAVSTHGSSVLPQSARRAIPSPTFPGGAGGQSDGAGPNGFSMSCVAYPPHVPPAGLPQVHKELLSACQARAFFPGVAGMELEGVPLSGMDSGRSLPACGAELRKSQEAGSEMISDDGSRREAADKARSLAEFQAEGMCSDSQYPQRLLEKLRELQLQKQAVAAAPRQHGAGNQESASSALQAPCPENCGPSATRLGNLRDPRQTLAALAQLNQVHPGSMATLLRALAGIAGASKAALGPPGSSSCGVATPGATATTHVPHFFPAGGVDLSSAQASPPQERAKGTSHQQQQQHPQPLVFQAQRSPVNGESRGEARGFLSPGCGDTADVAALAARILAQHRASLGAGGATASAGGHIDVPLPQSGAGGGGSGAGLPPGEVAPNWLQGGAGTTQQQELARLKLRQLQALQDSQKQLQRLLLQRQQGGAGTAANALGLNHLGLRGHLESQVTLGRSPGDPADSSSRGALSSVPKNGERPGVLCGGPEGAGGGCLYYPSLTTGGQPPPEGAGAHGPAAAVGLAGMPGVPPFVGGSAFCSPGLGVPARTGERINPATVGEFIQPFPQARNLGDSGGKQGGRENAGVGSSSASSTATSASARRPSFPLPSREEDSKQRSPRTADLFSSPPALPTGIPSLVRGGQATEDSRGLVGPELGSSRSTRGRGRGGPGGAEGLSTMGPAERGSRQHQRGGRGGGVGRRGAGRRGGGPSKHRGGIWQMMDDNIMDVSTWSL